MEIVTAGKAKAAVMKCPHCNLELKQESCKQRIVFRCPGCGGRMVTMSGLRHLSGDGSAMNRLWRAAVNDGARAGSPCVNCQRPTSRVPLPLEQTTLELDVCRRCQMVWFDPAELEQILSPEPQYEQTGLPPRFREMLALRQLQLAEERINREYRSFGAGEAAPDEPWKYLCALLGLPVELDAPPCRRRPCVTWGIALTCLMTFLLSWPHLGETISEWGFIPLEWSRKYGATLLTSMFLHGGILHLVGNLYFLLIFGDNVENEFGRGKYALLLLISGLCASGLHALFDPRGAIPCVGASGFISGVIACYAVSFPQMRLSFMLAPRSLYAAFLLRRNWFSIPAWAAFVIWLVLQLVLAHPTRPGGGVAYLAHIGGALPGMAFALICRSFRKSAPEQLPAFRNPE